jgi:hypothetical protein
MISFNHIRSIVLLLGICCLAGCGDRGPDRVVVSGTVTFNGKPLPHGNIRFMPTGDSAVPMAGTIVRDGVYKVERHGGVPVGAYKIEIEAYQVDKRHTNPDSPMARGAPRIQYLPKRYNANSELTITIEPGRAIVKDFALTN